MPYYILLSGYQEFDYVKKAMNLNVVDYLVKPVDKVELEHLLEKILGQLREKVHEPEMLSQKLDDEAFKAHLSQKRKLVDWTLPRETRGFCHSLLCFRSGLADCDCSPEIRWFTRYAF